MVMGPGWQWESVGMRESVCLIKWTTVLDIQKCRQWAALRRLVSKDQVPCTVQEFRTRLERGLTEP